MKLPITSQPLLFNPSAALLHDDLSSLWKRQASLTILPGSGDEQRAEGESEHDMEILRTERRRRLSRTKGVSQILVEKNSAGRTDDAKRWQL